MSDENKTVTVRELYDVVHEVRRENPHDGRTVAGRAWSDGAWAVMQKVYGLVDDELGPQ